MTTAAAKHARRRSTQPGRARHVVYGVLIGFLLVLAALAGLGAAISAGLVSPASGMKAPHQVSHVTTSAHHALHRGGDVQGDVTPVVRHLEEPVRPALLAATP